MSRQKVNLRNSIRYKYTLGLILFAILLSLSASTIGYYEFRANFEKQYKERAYTISKIIASQINGDHIYDYLKDANYNPTPVLTDSLQTLWETMDVRYIYFATTDASQVRFIYVKGGEIIYPTENNLQLGEKEMMGDYYVVREKDRAIGVNVPVFDVKQNIVGVVRTHIGMDDMKEGVYRYVVESILLNLLLAGIITVIYVSYIHRNFVAPIEKISQSALDFAASAYREVPSLPSPNTKDEIENLTLSLSQMTHDIKNYIQDIENNVMEKEKFKAELRVAKQIQAALLPTEFPNNEKIDMFALMDSAKEVGGDFYDFFYTEPRQMMLVIGDVSGKGIPAALFMTSTKEIIKNRTTDGNSPQRIFEIANNKLLENSDDRMFVTAWLGRINLESGELTYVSAGHPPAMIKRQDGGFGALTLNQNKLLAAFENTTYRQTTILLEAGDVIFLYTDGVIDAEKLGEQFGEKNLIDCLNRNIEKYESMKDFVCAVRREIGIYEKEGEQKDDVTMLAFRYHGKKVPRIDHIM